MDKLDRTSAYFNDDDFEIKLERQQNMTIANLPGKESVVEMNEKGEVSVIYSWFSSGETANAMKPEISITASVEKNNEAFKKDWNTLLASFSLRK